MGLLSPKLWWVALALLLWTPSSQCRNFTNEDIRDAMLSIVHLLRLSEDKLERHEFREKALGEQLKKMLTGLDKKHRALEPLKGMISRLDERLSNVETILLQKEGREKKTSEALEGIQKTLQSLTLSVQSLKPAKDTEIENNLTTNTDSIERRMDTTDAKIDAVKTEIDNLKKSLSKEALRAMCLEVASDVNPKPLEKHLSEAEKLLTKYELKLNEYNGTVPRVPTDIVQLNEVALADEAWHSKMAEEMERQGESIKKLVSELERQGASVKNTQQLVSSAEGRWKDELQASTNQTLQALVQNTQAIKENDDTNMGKVISKVRELSERLVSTNEDIQQSLTQGNTLAERAYGDISRSYDQLRTEVQTLTKSEQVMLQTADNVMATKKRIEYGVQQILMQVSDLILKQGKTLNSTVGDRLSQIEGSIVENQALAQVNLSAKIESEMSQVWRQIGIMHEQIKATKTTLDKLNEQTDHYVNASTTTMGKVKDQVNTISDRIVSLGDDFNYALGRLTLVTQQFGQISSGLADSVKALKSDVQDKAIKDAGPGPHKIASDEVTP